MPRLVRHAPVRRRPAALIALALLAVAAVPAGAAPSPTPEGAPSTPVQVVVTGLLPRAPATSSQVVEVTGQLVNRGNQPVSELRVQLAVADVVRTRSALTAAAQQPPRGRPRGPETAATPAGLGPGAAATFSLRTTVGALQLGRLGVYPVQVLVRGRSADAGRTAELGAASTFVPWFPDGAPAPSRLAFLWPLVGTPARAPDGAVLGDAVSTALRPAAPGQPEGRLAALLAAARGAAPGACDGTPAGVPGDPACRRDPVPVTYAVDPALLETAQTLAGPHPVVADGGQRLSVPGDPDAARWLADLRDAVAPRAGPSTAALLALPYADPDLVALTRSRSGLADDLDQLRLLGRRTAAQLTGATPLDAVAWPPAGRQTSAALDASVGGGATAVVLDQDGLVPRAPDVARTPGTRTQLSTASAGRVTGLILDPELSRLIAAGPGDPDWQGARLAEQRWLVETAMIAAERPAESRTFLVAPARRGTVFPGVAAEALRDAGRLPWLCPVPLAAVAAGTERCPPSLPDPRPAPADPSADLAPPDPAQPRAELPASYLAPLVTVRAQATQLTDEVLVPGSDAAAALKARFLRSRAQAVSSAWRDDLAGGRRIAGLYADDVADARGRIRIRTGGRQLLTSDTGVLDVSISNSLDQPVTVGVQLNDPIEARLTSTDTGVRTIGPSEVVPVRVRVQTRTSGQFVVRATLLDRSGQRFGEPAELVVRSTGYGRLAVAITGVGAAVLLVTAGVRILRRALGRTVAVGPEDGP